MEPAEETKSTARRTDINLDCRFYEQKYPNEGDYVKVFQSNFSDTHAKLLPLTFRLKLKRSWTMVRMSLY